ncbi:hypothetical protein [uncultured Microscilla sp.]|uniref:hypothetical protein n=1 Tax=uncultured Microscilla sp. TaxID=432653 RepID=UPI00261792FE|nr:hypothetical protein [uncultured Microscilla sp.]
MKRNSPPTKACIYLDQFAISDMVKATNDTIWFEIKEALEEAYRRDKVFCPASYEYFIESAQATFERGKSFEYFVDQISDGYSFKTEFEVTSQLISSYIRKNSVTQNTYLQTYPAGILSNTKKHNKLEEANKAHKSLIKKATAPVNELRKVTNAQKIEQKNKQQMISSMKIIKTFSFLARLEQVKKTGILKPVNDKIGIKSIPNWADVIIKRLLEVHNFSKKELGKLIVEVKNHNFDNIPSLDIRNTLEVALAIDSKKETSGDQMDISRIATGLPISEILLTDKKRKSELIEFGLDKKYGTKIFSGTKQDLPALRTTLVELCEK